MRPELNYVEWLRAIARRGPSAVALVDDERGPVTYGELLDEVDATAGRLTTLGLVGGRPVALACEPSVDYVVALLGVLAAGGVAAPVNTRLAVPEAQRYLDRIGPPLAIASPIFTDLVVGPDGRVVPLDAVVGTAHEEAERSAPMLPPQPTAPAVIFPTGGTTGLPKGAYTDHRGLALWVINVQLSHRRRRTDVELFFSPFFHATLIVCLLTPLFAGGTVIIHRTFEPQQAVDAVERHGVTHLGGTPTVLQTLIDATAGRTANFDGIERVIYGGTAAAPAFVERLGRCFANAEITTSYGATEFAGSVTRVEDIDARGGRLDGAGRPIAGATIEIRAPDRTPLPVGAVGEIAVRSPWQTLGYWNQPSETAATYGDDGFIQVGDLGRFDEDGWLHVVGRLKEMIITGGENVFPSEIERELSAIDGVAEAVAFGVPDSHWGERVEAAVRPAPQATLDPDAVRTVLHTVLAGYKVPKRIHVVEQIPVTASNKPDRRALVREFGGDVRPATDASLTGP